MGWERREGTGQEGPGRDGRGEKGRNGKGRGLEGKGWEEKGRVLQLPTFIIVIKRLFNLEATTGK